MAACWLLLQEGPPQDKHKPAWLTVALGGKRCIGYLSRSFESGRAGIQKVGVGQAIVFVSRFNTSTGGERRARFLFYHPVHVATEPD